ncbi:MAG: hypothetical protein AAEJ52_11145, partial [Myxococcota bacterium]
MTRPRPGRRVRSADCARAAARVWGTDAPILLSGLGIAEGDLIELTAVGSFITGRSNPFPFLFSGEANQ